MAAGSQDARRADEEGAGTGGARALLRRLVARRGRAGTDAPSRDARGTARGVARGNYALVGLAAFMAVADFVLWGGAFVKSPDIRFDPQQVIALFSVPCFLLAGALLVGGIARRDGRSPAARVTGASGRALCLLAAGCVCLAATLSTPGAPLPALVASAVLVGAGVAAGFSCWGIVLGQIGGERVARVVGGACILFPAGALGLALLPAAPSWLAVGILACIATVSAIPALRVSREAPNPPEASPDAAGGQGIGGREALVAAWRGYGSEALEFSAFGFIAGFSRTMSISSGVDNLVVTYGSPVFMLAAGVAVLALARRGSSLEPSLFFRLAVVLAASGLVAFAATGTGLNTAFACFGNFFFQFMLVVVAIDAPRRAVGGKRGEPGYRLAIGSAMVLAAVGTVAGMLAHRMWGDAPMGLAMTAAVCIYVLAMALILQWRRQEPGGGRGRAAGPGADVFDDVLDPGSAPLPARDPSAMARAVVDARALTPRESQVLLLMLRGMDGPGMARELDLSENTVRTHRKRLYRKLDIHSREELVELACDITAGRDVN